jgi:DNA-binding LacI/PurR family transcriptional regulator
MKATILDVAELAKVSKATVSRVINNKNNVSGEVRERVIQAIKELGFRPSGIARSLVHRKTKSLGLILPDITNPFFPALARGVEDAAHRYGYTVFLCSTDNEPEIERGYIDKLEEQQVEGIVLISSDKQLTHELQNMSIPFVLCDRWSNSSPIDIVTVDHYRGAYEAVEYLLNLGHQFIAHIAGPPNVQSAEKRKMGYTDAIIKAGLEPFVRHGSFSYESGYQVMASLLQEGHPTAVFAANDLMALGAIQAIEDAGLSVPRDIAIFGCDDIFVAQISKPPLSTIMQPAYQMGVCALEMLHERIEGLREEPKKIILEHRLVIRHSCGGGLK